MELIVIVLGIILGGILIAWGMNARDEAGELEQMRRFQTALRRADSLPPQREEK